ncbi:hypothetical protein ROZALSC1DRAFT_20846 [Rozella allomycis CSF55]|uniref:Cyclin N-terminal domain-containing protein n=1 Tax=Rozella allomycis (strain CSF55) TaxID=988480 RepID=A0A4P9YQR8_ROZAC|nr:hypothetical protein ROZALSC1DRAFT_20846 [Rozella allomycis CSF55]
MRLSSVLLIRYLGKSLRVSTITICTSQYYFHREYWKIRDSILESELLVLRILNFDLDVDMPHFYIMRYLRDTLLPVKKKFNNTYDFERFAHSLIEYCMRIANDSFLDRFYTKYSGREIAFCEDFQVSSKSIEGISICLIV